MQTHKRVVIQIKASGATQWMVVDNDYMHVHPCPNKGMIATLNDNDTFELWVGEGKFEGQVVCTYCNTEEPNEGPYFLNSRGVVECGDVLDPGSVYTVIIPAGSLKESQPIAELSLNEPPLDNQLGTTNLTGKLYGNPRTPPGPVPPTEPSSREGTPADTQASLSSHKPENRNEEKDMTNDTGTLVTREKSGNMLGLYFVKVEMGDGCKPGTPVVSLALVVQAASGNVSGLAEISQALSPPRGHYCFPVSGQVHQTGQGNDQQLVALSGEFIYSVPPPAIGSFLARFTAALAVDKSWNGSGGFNYLDRHVENAPVKKLT